MTNIVTSQAVYRPLYLIEGLGEKGRMPDGGIINAGGVLGPNFTVAGKPLLFADGTATDGSGAISIHQDFQNVYATSGIPAFIQFTSGKDFILNAVNNKQFHFNADTGLVTITGDLTVIGNTTAVINTVAHVQSLDIRPVSGSIVPFIFEPVTGVVPTNNLFSIKAIYGGPDVFTINSVGSTYIKTLNTGGPINGVDIVALAASLADHVNPAVSGIKHLGTNISVDTSHLTMVSGNTVQATIESIDTKLQALSIGGNVQGVEFIASTPINTWTINHNKNSKRVQVTIWDSNDVLTFADTVTTTSLNTVTVTFSSPQAGRAILMIF